MGALEIPIIIIIITIIITIITLVSEYYTVSLT